MREVEYLPFEPYDLQFNETDEVIHRNPDKSWKAFQQVTTAMEELGNAYTESILRNVSKVLKLDPQYVLEYYRKNVKKSQWF